MKVQLFVGSHDSDNASRMAVWSDLDKQNAYWDSLLLGNPPQGNEFEGDNWAGITEPIVVSVPPQYAGRYCYGRMQIPGGIWLYFSIDRFEYVTSKTTRFYYLPDYWETAQQQFFMQFGRAHIYRSARMLDYRLKRPYVPRSVRTVYRGEIEQSLALIAYCRDSGENRNYIMQINMADFTPKQLALVYNGDWINLAGIASADILGAWLSPWPLVLVDGVLISTSENVYIYKTVKIYESLKTRNINLPYSPAGMDDYVDSLTDLRGNTVWTSDYSDNWTNQMSVYPDITPTSFCWHGFITPKSPNNTAVEGLFTIPGEPVDVWNDSWLEYAVRERDYAIQMRRFANEKQLVQGLASVGGSGMSGAVAGAMGGAGGPVGAIAGVAIGVAQAGVGYGVNHVYGSKEQNATDEYFQMKRDELAFASSGAYTVISGMTKVALNRASVDDGTKARYLSDISNGGYYYDVDVKNVRSWLVNGPITANIEIRGLPGEWARQINARFQNGVVIHNE